MRPAPFTYVAPASIEETLIALDEAPPEAHILAGGQSLVPALRLRHIRASELIDINGVHELDYLRREGDRLAIGALTRQRTALASEAASAAVPLVGAALQGGFAAIQARGTVGGALAHGDLDGDLPLVLLTLGGEVRVRSRRGERTVAARDFYQGSHATTVADDELVTEVSLPAHDPTTFAYEKATAGVGAWRAIVNVAVVLEVADGHVGRAAIGLGGAGAKPLRAVAAERSVEGEQLDARRIGAAAEAAADGCEPGDDDGVSPGYRRHLVRVLVGRALDRAWEGRR